MYSELSFHVLTFHQHFKLLKTKVTMQSSLYLVYNTKKIEKDKNECITSVANCREENNHLCDEYEKYNNQVFVAESATFRVSFPDADA